MPRSRRALLKTGAAALYASLRHANAAGVPLDGKVVAKLPSKDAIWDWEKKLGNWSPPFTGSKNHRAYTAFLAEQLQAAGMTPQRKDFPIKLWDPRVWTLKLNGKTDVAVTSYRPYSGPTGPEGVTAEMVYIGNMPDVNWANVRGKIILVDTPAPKNAKATTPENDSIPLYTVRVADLEKAKAEGAVGCVYIWNNLSDKDAMDQALPFSGRPADTPCLWVGEKTGQVLKAEAEKGSKLTLTMYAEIDPNAVGENVWGILPGMTDDVVILNTHNDGCNAIEENGGLAVVALAQALGKVPKEMRQKTYVFFTSSGHFAHGYHRGSTDWMTEHADILKRAIACMTLEHLAGTEWTDDDRGVYRATGRVQNTTTYTPTAPMHGVMEQARAEQGADRMSVIVTNTFAGEGAQFARAKIPCIAYICAPDYLMTAPKGGEVARLSKDRMYDEIRTFARCIEQLDAMTREAAYVGMAEINYPSPTGRGPRPF